MAVFNGEPHLREQLDSLATQNFLPLELIVSDDVSDDHTCEIVRDFAERAPFPVTLVENDVRVGHVNNAHRAVTRCVGEVIARCDADDVWHPDKLRICGALFDRDPQVVLVQHSTDLMDGDGTSLGVRLPDYQRTKVFGWMKSEPRGLAPAIAQLYRRRLIEVGDFDSRPMSLTQPYQLDHDEWVLFLGFALGKVAHVRDSLVRYRRHGKNVSMDLGERVSDSSQETQAYVATAEHFRACADYLGALAGPDVPEWVRLQAASRYFDLLAQRWEARARARSSARTRAIGRILGLALGGGYGRRSRGGLGARSLAKDLVRTLS